MNLCRMQLRMIGNTKVEGMIDRKELLFLLDSSQWILLLEITDYDVHALNYIWTNINLLSIRISHIN